MESVSPSALASSIRSQLRILIYKNWMYWRFITSITRSTTDQLFRLSFHLRDKMPTLNATELQCESQINCELSTVLLPYDGYVWCILAEVCFWCAPLHLWFVLNECNRMRINAIIKVIKFHVNVMMKNSQTHLILSSNIEAHLMFKFCAIQFHIAITYCSFFFNFRGINYHRAGR